MLHFLFSNLFTEHHSGVSSFHWIHECVLILYTPNTPSECCSPLSPPRWLYHTAEVLFVRWKACDRFWTTGRKCGFFTQTDDGAASVSVNGDQAPQDEGSGVIEGSGTPPLSSYPLLFIVFLLNSSPCVRQRKDASGAHCRTRDTSVRPPFPYQGRLWRQLNLQNTPLCWCLCFTIPSFLASSPFFCCFPFLSPCMFAAQTHI